MSFFDKLKDIKKLKDLDSELAKERFEIEKEGIKITINGKSDILEIRLNPELSIDKQERFLIDAINEVSQKSKMAMAQKAAQISGLNF